jgi:RND superfamily putative drug exporter
VSIYLYRLARLAYARRRWVLAIWLVLLIGAVLIAHVSGGKTNNNFTIPGTESQQATDLLSAKIPAIAGGSTQVVFAAVSGVSVLSSSEEAAIEQVVTKLKSAPQVSLVIDPYQAKIVSPDGRLAVATVYYGVSTADVKTSTVSAVQDATRAAQQAGLQVEYGGTVYPGSSNEVSETPEIIGVIIAFVILLVAFGAFVAAGLPILNALIGVTVSLMAVTAVAAVVNIASASTTVAIMLGLSCGIDYSVFILSRHRTNLLRGISPEESVPLAIGTAGSSVVFAGLTVIIALCGLAVARIPFLTAMGLCAAGAVLIALLISLTLLPAMLGFAKGSIVRFLGIAPLRRHIEEVASRTANEPQRLFGARWARFVVRFRIPVLVGGVVLLGVIALPATKIQLGLPSGASQPKSTTVRKAYDLISEHFGIGYNGALLVVTDVSKSSSPTTAISQIATALKAEPGVVTVAPGSPQNGVAVIQVIPSTGPNDPKTATLVNHIRSDRSKIEDGTGATILVGGTTAGNIDTSTKLSDALPLFLLVVVGLAFILLTFAFRTILVPIKSIIGFLLSVFAAFGAQVAVFQWGWGKSLFGITPTETLSFLPTIMLAIIFGLSSDYEVFVVSRIKEDFTKTGDARGAVERGTTLSARVISAAALIMFAIFVAFMFTNDPTTKALAFSFATGVFLDAFVVRLTLVPAVMSIVASKLWYHPHWFTKYVPDPDIEGQRLESMLSSEHGAAVKP